MKTFLGFLVALSLASLCCWATEVHVRGLDKTRIVTIVSDDSRFYSTIENIKGVNIECNIGHTRICCLVVDASYKDRDRDYHVVNSSGEKCVGRVWATTDNKLGYNMTAFRVMNTKGQYHVDICSPIGNDVCREVGVDIKDAYRFCCDIHKGQYSSISE